MSNVVIRKEQSSEVLVLANDSVTETGYAVIDGVAHIVSRPANRPFSRWHGSPVEDGIVLSVLVVQGDDGEGDDGEVPENQTTVAVDAVPGVEVNIAVDFGEGATETDYFLTALG